MAVGGALAKVAGMVDLVLPMVGDDFLMVVVVWRSGVVIFSCTVDWEIVVSGGVRSAGGSRLLCLGVREGGKK